LGGTWPPNRILQNTFVKQVAINIKRDVFAGAPEANNHDHSCHRGGTMELPGAFPGIRHAGLDPSSSFLILLDSGLRRNDGS
jgi:hypothetical protein